MRLIRVASSRCNAQAPQEHAAGIAVGGHAESPLHLPNRVAQVEIEMAVQIRNPEAQGDKSAL
jgi:hypothetical protein